MAVIQSGVHLGASCTCVPYLEQNERCAPSKLGHDISFLILSASRWRIICDRRALRLMDISLRNFMIVVVVNTSR